MTSIIHSESEMKIYGVSSDNKLNGIAGYTTALAYLMKKKLISFDDDVENILLNIPMHLQIVSTYIYNGYPKSKFEVYFWVLESQINHVLNHLTAATLKDDVIVNIWFQRLGSY